MSTAILVYYLMAMLIPLGVLVTFCAFRKHKSYNFITMTFLILPISASGYLGIAMARTLDAAVMANKVAYMGGCFIPLFTFLIICRLCKIKLSDKIKLCLLVFCVVVYSFVLSTGFSDVYYSSVELGSEYGVTHLEKTYGPAHVLYIVLLVGFCSACLAAIIYAFTRQKQISYKNSLLLLAMLLASVATYAAERAIGTTIEFMPLCCAVSSVLLFALHRRIEKYDVEEMVTNTLEDTKTYGYIVLSNRCCYIGCNNTAGTFFPELLEQKIDYPLDSKLVIYGKIMENVKALESGQESIPWHIRTGGFNLRCKLSNLYYRKHKNGYLVEISDDTRQQRYLELINNYNTTLETEIENKTRHIMDIQNKLILAMANMVENRDDNTGGHIKRTSDVVSILVTAMRKCGREFPISDEFLRNVVKAAPMHDLGKIAIDDSILKKPGKFTPEEYEQMKLHTVKGVSIIESVLKGAENESFIRTAKNIAKYHHEKWNGEGYPEHLSGENIPIEARIMALADVFDALVSERCYKAKMPYDKAFEIINDSLGSHFDPKIGKVFITCRPQLEAYYDNKTQ